MLHNKGGTYDYARNWYYSVLGKQQEYTKHKGKYRAVLQMGYFSIIYFSSSLTLWTADISETQQVGFQNVDAYHQVYSTNSKTQPSASILLNKALDINTHPLKPKTSKMLYSWWTLYKFRESKGYLCRQYMHGTYRTINTKVANFLFSPICRYSEKSKKTRAEGK